MTKLKRLIKTFILGLICTSFTSCDPAVWEGIAMGVLGAAAGMGGYTPVYGGGYGGTSSYTTTSTSSYSSSSSSSSSSRKTCTRCNGTGNCKTCGGTGRVYDYGSMSIVSHEKYDQRCGVCNGRKTCGVCDGKGYY